MSDTDYIAKFANRAFQIANGPVRSRAGFGALRKSKDLYRNTLRLIFDSAVFVPPQAPGSYPWPFDVEDILIIHRDRPTNPRFFKDILTSPARFDPDCIWAMFWAIAKAEHEFVRRYLPFWSHEERLTGHIVSQVIERVAEFAPEWRELAQSNDSKDTSLLDIWYADTATARREALTGADLGLVIHAKYSDDDEFFKVIRFQAKKVYANGSSQIDLDQTETLLRRERLGYYLFYHAEDSNGWTWPPTVSPATTFKSEVEKRRKERGRNVELGTQSLNAKRNNYDFATFVTFAAADPGSDHGRTARNPIDAVRILMGGDGPSGPPSRIMVISMGFDLPPIDWSHTFGEFLGGQGDEGRKLE